MSDNSNSTFQGPRWCLKIANFVQNVYRVKKKAETENPHVKEAETRKCFEFSLDKLLTNLTDFPNRFISAPSDESNTQLSD